MTFVRNVTGWSFRLIPLAALLPVVACSDDGGGDAAGTSSMAGTGGVVAGGAGAAGSGGLASLGGAAGTAVGGSGAGGSGAARGGASGAGGSSGGAMGGVAGSSAGGLATGGSSGDTAGGMGGSTAGDAGTSGAAGTEAGAGGASGAGMGGMAGKGGAGSGGTAGGGKGGGAGTAGASSCPSALVGWATASGDGVTTTTGGGNAAPVRPANATELMDYASDSTPRVIEIAGTFNVPRLQINSNKTLLGVGNDATVNGGLRIRGSSDTPVQNVIVRNLRVNGTTTDVDSDAAQIYFAHHIWIDHSEIWDGPDGNLDMTHAVNWVTVSWTKFRYTTAYQRPSGEDADHRFSSLIGHSDDNASEDDGRLKITFHHNWWADRVIERMPRVRFGQVHVFNNYFASPGNNYCVRAGTNAHLLVEGNYFDGVKSPHEFNNSDDEGTAHITARNNVYDNTTGNVSTGGGGTPLTSVPYAHTVEPANDVPTLVQSCAGPR
jgi:pectate lyase